MAMPRSPAAKIHVGGRRAAVRRASEAVTVERRRPGRPARRAWTNAARWSPPTAAVCTPARSVSAVSSPSAHCPHVELGGVVDRVRLELMSSLGASITPRTCRSAGVTGSPSTNRRRAPSRSPAVTSRPSASSRGQAGTSSTQASSSRRRATRSRPVAGSTRQRHRPALIAGDDRHEQTGLVQSTVARYGKDSRSQSTSSVPRRGRERAA